MQRLDRRRRHTPITVILTVLALALVGAAAAHWVSSASAESSSSPASSGGKLVLRMGWTNDPDNLNPFIGYESSSYEVWMLNYDQLTELDPATLKPSPGLAKDWKITDGGKVWTFNIRKGVKWQDGKPLTAADVAFTYNYIIDNEMGNFTNYTEFIDHVEAVDDYTARFVCSQPKANMLGLWVPILPEHIWSKVDPQEAGKTYVNKPPIIGSGPFKVVEVKKGQYVRMVANKSYWKGAPHVDEVIFQTYENPDTMAQDMRAGSLDAAWNIPEAQIKPLDNLPDVVAHAYVPVGMDELGINCYEGKGSLGNPVLRDVRFRQALNYAVDKQRIKEIAYSGYGITGESIVQPDKYTDPDWHWEPPSGQAYTFDLEKAKSLLDAAGYKDTDGDNIRDYKNAPISLRLYARSESPTSQKAGKLIAGWLGQIGLDIKYEVIDDGVLADKQFNYVGDTFAPDYDLFLWGWGGDIDPNFILSVFTSGQIESWSDCNWSNAEYDQLFKDQQKAVDPQQRKQIIDRMQQIFYEESPYVVLMYPASYEAYNTAKWQGWVRSPAKVGSVWYWATNMESYLNLRPRTTAAGSSGSSLGLIVGIVVAGVVVLGAVAWIVLRRRHRPAEEEN